MLLAVLMASQTTGQEKPSPAVEALKDQVDQLRREIGQIDASRN
jgi:hypothetical protein